MLFSLYFAWFSPHFFLLASPRQGGGGYQEEDKELHELPKQINCKIFIRLTFGQEGRSPRGIYHEKYSPHSIPVIVYY